jgi:hypothetical protein
MVFTDIAYTEFFWGVDFLGFFKLIRGKSVDKKHKICCQYVANNKKRIRN